MRIASRRVSVLSSAALVAAAAWVVGAAPVASAAGCWNAYAPPTIAAGSIFYGTTALTSTSTWAVGNVGAATLVEHWDGCTWKRQASENATGGTVTGSILTSVTAVSPTDQWAVGYYIDTNVGYIGMIEQWNGSTWSIVTAPKVTGFIEAVDALTTKNVWAVGGEFVGSGTFRSLVEHWDGTSWKRQYSPSPGTPAGFKGVSALAANNVWAAGSYTTSNHVDQTLIEHWNGSQWKVVPSPNKVGPSTANDLEGIFMLSATNGWAVGDYTNANDKRQTLILHWNGSVWTIVKSPNPGGTLRAQSLNSVFATSGGNAWAVGDYVNASSIDRPLVERWDGHAWTVQPVSAPAGTDVQLLDISAATATNAWTVGGSFDSAGYHAFAAHCC